jgi:glycosyltransferase involved in cell wall biosynthesis
LGNHGEDVVNVLLLTSHSIAEYDDLRMLTDLGYDVFSIGAYTDPVNPTDDKRPALAHLPQHDDLAERCEQVRREMGDPGHNIDWAKAHLHPDIIDWADVIIVHHFPESWIYRQWTRIKHKRVIWRTCGQSSPDGSLEALMGQLDGLEIVRYSPKERVLPNYAGETALIRFGKYPADYGPWTGEWEGVINITQHMAQRGDACGYRQWQDLTRGLARPIGALPEDGPPPPFALPLGPGSDAIGGTGELTYAEMRGWLNRARAYLYTGTHPASYTLGFMEAMLSGIPVVAPPWDTGNPILDGLYEARDLIPRKPAPETIPHYLRALFADHAMARHHGEEGRQAALALFDVAVVGPQWQAVLG